MQKMAEAGAKAEAEKGKPADHGEFKATGEKQVINGYNCTKYVYTYNDSKRYGSMDMWLTNEISLNLGDNYLFGARLNAYKYPAGTSNSEMKGGMAIRTVMYDKNGNITSQRDITQFSKSADEQYFDMSRFTVKDVLDQL